MNPEEFFIKADSEGGVYKFLAGYDFDPNEISDDYPVFKLNVIELAELARDLDDKIGMLDEDYNCSL